MTNELPYSEPKHPAPISAEDSERLMDLLITLSHSFAISVDQLNVVFTAINTKDMSIHNFFKSLLKKYNNGAVSYEPFYPKNKGERRIYTTYGLLRIYSAGFGLGLSYTLHIRPYCRYRPATDINGYIWMRCDPSHKEELILRIAERLLRSGKLQLVTNEKSELDSLERRLEDISPEKIEKQRNDIKSRMEVCQKEYTKLLSYYKTGKPVAEEP